jgi:hypothetical protein
MTAEDQIAELKQELAEVRADLELCMAGLAVLVRQRHDCVAGYVIG